MYCEKLTDIVVCNAPWKTYYLCVYRGKLIIIVCTVENLLTSCVLMYRRKLIITVCTVENLLTSCVLWKTYYHRVYCGKLTDIVCTVEN